MPTTVLVLCAGLATATKKMGENIVWLSRAGLPLGALPHIALCCCLLLCLLLWLALLHPPLRGYVLLRKTLLRIALQWHVLLRYILLWRPPVRRLLR